MQFRQETSSSAPVAGLALVKSAARPFAAPFQPELPLPLIQVHLVVPPLVCWGLQRLLQTAGAPFVVVGSSDRLERAVPLLERQPPDVLMLDLDDGYTVEDLARLYDRLRLKVLVLSSLSDGGPMEALLRAGARGVLHKRAAPAMLLKAIEAVGMGQVFTAGTPDSDATPILPGAALAAEPVRPAVALPARQPDADQRRIASLTLRERQTIAAVTSDASAPVKVVAGRLCISEHTLRNHLTSIYSKLGVSGRLELFAYAARFALNQPPAVRDRG